MSQFLLPCRCGGEIHINRSQAGMSLPCPQCGELVEVPTIRKMAELRVATESPTSQPAKQSTALRLFAAISLIVGLVGLFDGGMVFWERSSIIKGLENMKLNMSMSEDDFLGDMKELSMKASPADTWDYWNQLIDEGLTAPDPPEFFKYKRYVESRSPRMIRSSVIGFAGLLFFAICSVAMFSGKRK
jgi:hypothetical protein